MRKLRTCLMILLAALAARGVCEQLYVELSEKPLGDMTDFSKVLDEYKSDFRAALKAKAGLVETLRGRADKVHVLRKQQYKILRQQALFARQLREASQGQWTVEQLAGPDGAKYTAGTSVIGNTVIVDIGASDVAQAVSAVSMLRGVKSVRPVAASEPKMYEAIEQIGANKAWEEMKVQDATAGKGVKIGFVDNGVYMEHPMMSGNGIESLDISWAQGPLDKSNQNNKVALSRMFETQYSYPSIYGDCHGISLASIAAGRAVSVELDGAQYNISGVAPGAWVFNYFGDNQQGLEYVVTDKADVATVAWGYEVSAFYNSYYPWYKGFVQISLNNIFLVKSAGNEGPGTLTADHVAGAAGGIVVGAATKASVTVSYLEIEGRRFNFTRTVPAGPLKLEYKLQHFSDKDTRNCTHETNYTFGPDDIAVIIPPLECEMKDLGEKLKGHIGAIIFASLDEFDINPGFFDFPFVVVTANDGFDIFDLAKTNPGTSVRIGSESFAAKPDAVASFSSRGPSVEMSLTPHVIAPGVSILAGGWGDAPDPRVGYSFQSGASMATGIVAGAAAIIRQRHPNFTNAEVKSALMSTATYASVVREEDGEPAGVLDMGAGRIDLAKALDPVLRFDPPLVDFSLVRHMQTVTRLVKVSSYSATPINVKISVRNHTAPGEMKEVHEAHLTVQPTSFTVSSLEQPKEVEFTFRSTADTPYGDHGLYVVFLNADTDAELGHIPLWAQSVCSEEERKDVFLITLDSRKCANASAPHVENLRAFYEAALNASGHTYETYEFCDTMVLALPLTVQSLCFRAVIIASGTDYGYPLNPIENELRRLMHSGVPVIQMGAHSALNWGPIDSDSYGSRWIFDHEFGFNTPPNAGWQPKHYTQVSKVDRYALIETHVPKVDRDDYDWECNVIFKDPRDVPLVFLFRDQPLINEVHAVFGSTGVTSFVGVEQLANEAEHAPFLHDIYLAATETNTSGIRVAYTYDDQGFQARLTVSITSTSKDRMLQGVQIFWDDKNGVITDSTTPGLSYRFSHDYESSRSFTPFVRVISPYQNSFVYPLGSYVFEESIITFFHRFRWYIIPAACVLVIIIAAVITIVVVKVRRSRAKGNAYKNLEKDLIDNEQ